MFKFIPLFFSLAACFISYQSYEESVEAKRLAGVANDWAMKAYSESQSNAGAIDENYRAIKIITDDILPRHSEVINQNVEAINQNTEVINQHTEIIRKILRGY